MTKSEFLKTAAPITVNFGDARVTLEPREFSTGSVGWGYMGKVDMPFGENDSVRVQGNINMVAVGSKNWEA